MANPTVCKLKTDMRMFLTIDDPTTPVAPPPGKKRDAFCATTPPHNKDTKMTPANGAILAMVFATFGNAFRMVIPRHIGPSMTCVVALHKAIPDTAMLLALELVEYVSVLTSKGVSIEARIVDAVVKMTESATSALAMSATRLDAVPPGQHPTRISPRNAAELMGSNNLEPMAYAVSGMMRY
mmetsp:Transcript_14681/g.16710  ORF Transcript_14681/g.16710 Transcript_14681/m.16710 type:complete len:182 (+) Transcript_14681:472-1017(+)